MNYGIRRRGHRLVEAATFKMTLGETDCLDSGAVPAWIDVRRRSMVVASLRTVPGATDKAPNPHAQLGKTSARPHTTGYRSATKHSQKISIPIRAGLSEITLGRGEID
jgi:hypothetical protein